MHQFSDPKKILIEIAASEKQLTKLHGQQLQIEMTLQNLNSQLANCNGSNETFPRPISTQSYSQAEKVTLFKTLFRGREDVYPTLWINKKTSKKGYSPACSNEWKREVCKKPKIRCGEYPNQAFLAVKNKTILSHLQGHHVIGVYPMLEDETCWFLAVDFDKANWQKDVIAFSQISNKFNIPHAIERSRSGNGAHVWFFFESSIPATIASVVIQIT